MRFRTSGTNWEGRPWSLAPSLVVLGNQISKLHPQGHGADGTVASRNHDKNNPSSDHRPKPITGRGIVRGLDAGENVEDDAFKMAESIRLSRDRRIKYVLHEGRIFSSYGSEPYKWRKFSGAPHTSHVHFSTLPEYDGDTRLWVITQGGPPDMGNWAKPGDEVEDVEDMKAVHKWQGNDVFTDKDIDYEVGEKGSLVNEEDWRMKFSVTKVVNVMMK